MAHLYIALPQGWCFAGKRDVSGVLKDVLINHANTQIILLQDIIKDCLRTKKRSSSFVTVPLRGTERITISTTTGAGIGQDLEPHAITIYFKKPPYTKDFFLQYTPKNNGKYPSDVETHVVKGSDVVVCSAMFHTMYGQKWHNLHFFSKEKMAEILAAEKEQRDNRRHVGDNPLPT
ncbi:hypothetical protein [Legionella brunensis]|uniref:Permease n=1 Tax=Legionella brunensis TaxID=29422 RepID=A0A0W0S5W2_9GAMM|nr:hypothetical protein [Legionella brunensis]KTC78309.1 Permease [Legionella brunensis]